MAERGRPKGPSFKLPAGKRPGKSKYKCNVCPAKIVAYDLGDHYIRKANNDLLNRLQKCTRDSERKILLEAADPHTRYLFTNNFSASKPPSYKVGHVRAEPLQPQPSQFVGIDQLFARQRQERESTSPEENVEDVVAGNSNEVDDSVDLGDTNDMVTAGEEVDTVDDDNEEEADSLSDPENQVDDDIGVEEEMAATPGGTSPPNIRERGDEGIGEVHSNESDQDRNDGAEDNGEIVLTDETIEKLALQIVKAMKRKEIEESQDKTDLPECFVTGEEFVVCRSCAAFSWSLGVPAALAKLRKGSFGVFRSTQNARDLRRHLKDHLTKDLYIWCANQEKETQTREETLKAENEKAGKEIIWNLLHCLKRSGSSVDFVSLNDLNHIVGGEEYCGAVKNNSRRTFFELRELVFETVTEDMHDLFRDESKIQNIACSLDKVTVFNVSFTVLMTYYFFRAKIYAIVNELHHMDENEYNSEGTALMVVEALQRTLGISRSRLIAILQHFW